MNIQKNEKKEKLFSYHWPQVIDLDDTSSQHQHHSLCSKSQSKTERKKKVYSNSLSPKIIVS